MLASFLQLGSTGRVFYPDSATMIEARLFPGHEPRPGLNQIQTTVFYTKEYTPQDRLTYESGGFLFTLSDDGNTVSNVTLNGVSLLNSRMTVDKINGKYYMIFTDGFTVGTVFAPNPPRHYWDTITCRTPF